MIDSTQLVGENLGAYRIIRVIGAGGMGTVYHAVHSQIAKNVALKVLHPARVDEPGLVERFVAEARVVNEIRHPNIIDISDIGVQDGRWFLVMELLEGETLRSALRRGEAFGAERAATIALQIGGAVGAAHELGVVHRDLKPENVFLSRRGGFDDFAVVMDFGIAKLEGRQSFRTQTGTVMGTPHYMSPEQAEGLAVDGRTDVYAIGVMLYEMLGGRRPFDGETATAILKKIWTEDPVPLKDLCPHVSLALCELVMRSFARDVNERIESAPALCEALAAAVPRARAPVSPGTANRAVVGHGHSSKLAMAETLAAAPADQPTASTGPIAGEAAARTVVSGKRRRRSTLIAVALCGGFLALFLWWVLGPTSQPRSSAPGRSTAAPSPPPRIAKGPRPPPATATKPGAESSAGSVSHSRAAKPRRTPFARAATPEPHRLSVPATGRAEEPSVRTRPADDGIGEAKKKRAVATAVRTNPHVPFDSLVLKSFLLRRHGDAIRRCLRLAPAAREVSVNFVLRPTGRLVSAWAVVNHSIPNQSLATSKCLKSVLHRALLPRTPRGGAVRIHLKPGSLVPAKLHLRLRPLAWRSMVAFIRTRLGASIEACFAPTRRASKVDLKIEVDADGVVRTAKPHLSADHRYPKVGACLAREVRALRLPRTRAGGRFVLTLKRR